MASIRQRVALELEYHQAIIVDWVEAGSQAPPWGRFGIGVRVGEWHHGVKFGAILDDTDLMAINIAGMLAKSYRVWMAMNSRDLAMLKPGGWYEPV